jgi:sec-independent protein translocase protein TatB
MFDLGWSEMAIILVVALLVIGPKDLPRVAREIGRWSAKARSMAREFQRSLDDMAREAELQDIKAEIEKASRTNVQASIERFVDPDGELSKALDPKALDPKAAPPAPKAALPTPAASTERTVTPAVAGPAAPRADPPSVADEDRSRQG